MKILCFGLAAEIIGQREYIISDEQPSTVEALRGHLLEQFPQFREYHPFMLAVNQVYALAEQQLSSNDEIAIIPPVSGG